MNLRNGFIAKDSTDHWKYYEKRPTSSEWSSFWNEEGYRISKELFEDLPDVDWKDSVRQIIYGKIIMPLPELEVDAMVTVSGAPVHFSHWDEYGNLYFFTGGRTSWTGKDTEIADNWALPEVEKV